MDNIVSDKLINFTRKLLKKQDSTGLFFGVRFNSNELVKANNAEIVNLYNYSREQYPLLSRDVKVNTEYVNAVYKYRSGNV